LPGPVERSTVTRNPDVIAHRGFAGAFPENTVAAVVAAGLHPETHTVEIDTMPAADGTPVVVHDERLDGARGDVPLTDRTGLVRETPPEVVTGATVLDSGETVPTLSAVAEALPVGVRLNVELKRPGDGAARPGERLSEAELATRRDRWRPFLERVTAVLDPVERVLYSSFCEAAVAEAAAAGGRTAPLAGGDDAPAWLGVAREYGCSAFHPAKEAVFADPELVDRAVEVGCEVNAWTARTWHDVKRLREAGVHGVIADYPTLGLAGTRS
jgi:glycerophosphoryl diester phosphodiesterase